MRHKIAKAMPETVGKAGTLAARQAEIDKALVDIAQIGLSAAFEGRLAQTHAA